DHATARAAALLIKSSLALAAVMVVDTVAQVVMLNSHFDEFDFAFLAPYVAGLATSLTLPLCAYVGAKTRNVNLLCTACVCASTCLGCSIFGLITALGVLVGFGPESFNQWGLTTSYYVVAIAFDVVLAVLFGLAAFSSWNLRNKIDVTVVVIPHTGGAPVDQGVVQKGVNQPPANVIVV
ncbi:Hypothetical protein SCF082_LOCUS51081, partial [Durusdinium trenchii]